MERNLGQFNTASTVSAFPAPQCALEQDKLYQKLNQFSADGNEVSHTLYLLAKIYYDKSDFSQAESFFLNALDAMDSEGNKVADSFSEIKILGFLIRIASEGMNDVKTGKYIEMAEKVIEKLASSLTSFCAEYYYNIGLINNYKGTFKKAEENFLMACRKGREENEPGILAKCFLSLAMNSFSSKKYEESLKYLHQLKELLKVIRKKYLCASMYLFSGKVYCLLGKYSDALESLEKAAETFQEKKCWNLHGYIFLWRGIVYKEQGELDRAALYYKSAMELIDKNLHKKLYNLLKRENEEINDSDVDIYIDCVNRKIVEKELGVIDFKHRFVLLEILFLLAKNIDVNFGKEELVKFIWKDEYNPLIHDKLIYTSISRLRKLIEPKNIRGEKRKYIIRGKDGYAFNPRVKIRFKVEDYDSISDSFGNRIPNIDFLLPV